MVFFGLFAVRALSSRRRRQGPGMSGATRSFHDVRPQADNPHVVDEPLGQVPFTGIAPGWLIDPTGRHEKRYWSGSEWTEHVTDGGAPSIDPPPRTAGPETSS